MEELKEHILVVDDQIANIFLLEGLLTNKNYQVSTASSGKQALEILENNIPELILLDIMMPEMSGLDVLKIISKDDRFEYTPVIMISAKSNSTDVQEALDLGASDYLKKPFSEIELLARVRTALRIKHQEDELLHMYKSRDDFIRIISHDLRAPFTAISGFAELLLVDDELKNKLEEDHIEFLNHIYNAALFSNDYFNKLLNWLKLNKGELELKKEMTNLKNVLEKAIIVFNKKMEDKNLSIDFNVPSEKMIKIDETFFSQAFGNILSNAIKFSPENETIYIYYIDGYLCIQDNGAGIIGMTNDELFNKEFHKSKRGTSGEKGTGTGMNICKNIMGAHGFELLFESPESGGTIFKVKVD